MIKFSQKEIDFLINDANGRLGHKGVRVEGSKKGINVVHKGESMPLQYAPVPHRAHDFIWDDACDWFMDMGRCEDEDYESDEDFLRESGLGESIAEMAIETLGL